MNKQHSTKYPFSMILALTFVLVMQGTQSHAQQLSPVQVLQAKSQLETMSSDQIDAKIKEFGMTREEAEAKANSYGINLETYLSRKGEGTIEQQKDAATPSTSPKPAEQEKSAPAVKEAFVQETPKKAPKSASDNLKYYGYEIFQSPYGAFEPRPFIDEQYILGEGDVIKISLSGELQSYNEYTVNAEGRVLISGIGPILVSGYTVEKAKKSVTSAMGNVYSGLVRNPPTIFMDLSVARIRPVRIFMTGEVENPGGYAVSNFGNVFNSLFSVGGPKISGSLRDIRVIRNNKVIAKVDIYDYLFGSPKSNDVRVNDNDIIFIPLRGKSAAINGEVLRPFTYELLPGENLRKLIEFSGGFRSNIYTERIQIDRIIPFSERVKGSNDRKIFDIDFKDIAAGKKDFTIEDGDVVTLFPILDKKDNYVVIEGDVKRPGRYQFDKIRTVRDLVLAADSLWPTVYLKRAELMREFPDEQRQMIVLDLAKVMANDPANNLLLQKKDEVKIYNVYDLNKIDSIKITGHSKKTGKFAYADSMTIGKLLYSLVGLEDSVYRALTFLDRADIFRLNEDKISRRRMEFSISDILSKTTRDIPIVPGDEIRIYALNEIHFLYKDVDVFGNVKKPGKYRISDGLTVTDLILLAGGYTEDAWTLSGEIARVTRDINDKDSLLTILFTTLPDLFDTTRSAKSIIDSKAGSFILMDKDQLFIRPNPEYLMQELVTVSGYVRFPGKYAIAVEKERLSDVIIRAGGLQKNGYARGGQLLRNDERLRSNIEEAMDDRGGKYDATLFNGDSIYIPKIPNTVRVSGEVNNPGRYSYVPGETRNFYIDMAGGTSDSADFALVSFPEGYIEKSSFYWIFSANPDIPDGSEIYVKKVVPPKPKTPLEERQTTFVEIFKETTAIIATALTILVLATQLK